MNLSVTRRRFLVTLASVLGCSTVPSIHNPQLNWGKNVKVLAATSSMDPVTFGSHYTEALLINTRTASGFIEAHKILEQKGYVNENHIVHPTSSMTGYPCWDKRFSAPRAALVFGSTDPAPTFPWYNIAVQSDVVNVTNILKTCFSLDDTNIQSFDRAIPYDEKLNVLWKGIEKLGEFAKTHPNSEILIYYSGHGEVKSTKDISKASDTEVWLGGNDSISENAIKRKILDEIGDNTPVLFILDCCNSHQMVA